MFFTAVKTLPLVNIDYPKDTRECIINLLFNFCCICQIFNNHIMTLQYFGSVPTRGLLICFSCIFLLMLLLHKSTKFHFVKKSPTPKISRKISVKGENHQDNTLTELKIDFTNISVLREVMIKG